MRCAFQDGSVTNLIAVPILTRGPILKCGKSRTIHEDRRRVQGTDDLIHHVLNCVTVPDASALVEMLTKEKNLCHNGG